MLSLFWHRPIIYRYLQRDLWRTFAAILLILLAILISFRFSNLLSAAARGDLGLQAIAPMLGLQIVRFVVLLLPMAFVLASALVLARLHNSLENTALLACGVPYRVQQSALLGYSLPLALGLLVAHLYLMPTVYLKQEEYLQRARQEAAMALITPQTFRTLPNGAVVYAKALSDSGLSQFFYHQPNAEHASITVFAENAMWQNNARALVLHHGTHLEHHTNTSQLASFERATFALPEPEISHRALLRHLYPHELNHSPAHQSEWFTRLSAPISLLIYSLFLPLFARQAPRSTKQRTLPIFFGYAAYFTLLNLATSLIRKGNISLWLASILIHGTMLFAAVYLWKNTHEFD